MFVLKKIPLSGLNKLSFLVYDYVYVATRKSVTPPENMLLRTLMYNLPTIFLFIDVTTLLLYYQKKLPQRKYKAKKQIPSYTILITMLATYDAENVFNRY